MNKVFYLIPIILGIGIGVASLTIAPSLIQQEAFATAYGGSSSSDVIANPSGLSESNATAGNITSGNITGTENITLAQ
jgi:hypothetical protein